jgi:hypothetical protein
VAAALGVKGSQKSNANFENKSLNKKIFLLSEYFPQAKNVKVLACRLTVLFSWKS